MFFGCFLVFLPSSLFLIVLGFFSWFIFICFFIFCFFNHFFRYFSLEFKSKFFIDHYSRFVYKLVPSFFTLIILFLILFILFLEFFFFFFVSWFFPFLFVIYFLFCFFCFFSFFSVSIGFIILIFGWKILSINWFYSVF